MNKTYVIGGAQSDFKRNYTKEGKNVIALLREVIEDGLKNISLTYDDIINLNKEGKIACFVGNFIGEHFIDQGHLGALLTEVNEAFYGVPSARYEAACASGSVAIDAASAKIRAKDYEIALVIGFELMKTVDSKECGDYLGRAAYYQDEAKNIDFPFPKLFGQLANETIKKYNFNEDEYLNALAIISNKNYSNAKKNENAQTRKWFSSYIESNTRNTNTNPLIGDKLAITDCSQVTDGAVFVALASEDFVKNKYGNVEFPYIKGYGHTVAPMKFNKKIEYSANDKYILPFTRQAVLMAYKKAGLDVEDIDFFETHDCFTSSEFAAVSCFGICQPGDEIQTINDGVTLIDGKFPINPSGGLIGVGHPVGASGVRMLLDLYKQVSNCEINYQVENCKNGLMLNIGGSATTNYVFILGRD